MTTIVLLESMKSEKKYLSHSYIQKGRRRTRSSSARQPCRGTIGLHRRRYSTEMVSKSRHSQRQSLVTSACVCGSRICNSILVQKLCARARVLPSCYAREVHRPWNRYACQGPHHDRPQLCFCTFRVAGCAPPVFEVAPSPQEPTRLAAQEMRE